MSNDNNQLREAIHDAIAAALGDAYDCTRVWSAWSYGTMGQDDFSLITDDSDRMAELTDAALSVIASQPAAAQEAVAWRDDAGNLYPDKESVDKYLPRGRTVHALYAAPVAAAPVGVTRDDAEQVISRIMGEYGFSMPSRAYAELVDELMSTPAAPGIDITPFHTLVEASEDIRAASEECDIGEGLAHAVPFHLWNEFLSKLDAAQQVIDASPKGVEHCTTCGGSGDVHTADGEWRGECYCNEGRSTSPKGGSDALARAYGYLWHVNHPEDIPAGHPFMSADRAAVEARKELRDMLTHEQRGEGINSVRQKLLADMQATSAEVGA